MKTTLFSLVMKHFEYLVADYGFLVNKVEMSEGVREIEGRIEFESTRTFVTVSSEQWMVGASIGRVGDDKYRFFLSPSTIYEYMTLTEAEKKLVRSLDPKDDRRARIVIHRTRLLHKKTDSDNGVDDIDSQLADYSIWLRQYADTFLRGDFSHWLDIYEYKVIRTRAAHIRAGKEEFIRVAGRSDDVRESIFQNSIDYLEKLRKEYEGK